MWHPGHSGLPEIRVPISYGTSNFPMKDVHGTLASMSRPARSGRSRRLPDFRVGGPLSDRFNDAADPSAAASDGPAMFHGVVIVSAARNLPSHRAHRWYRHGLAEMPSSDPTCESLTHDFRPYRSANSSLALFTSSGVCVLDSMTAVKIVIQNTPAGASKIAGW